VQNREKQFVKANLSCVTKAPETALVEIPEDLRHSLTHASGKGSYPIGTTWAIVHVRQPRTRGRQFVDFLSWAIGDGQARVQDLL
jgi:hypothetical protein